MTPVGVLFVNIIYLGFPSLLNVNFSLESGGLYCDGDNNSCTFCKRQNPFGIHQHYSALQKTRICCVLFQSKNDSSIVLSWKWLSQRFVDLTVTLREPQTNSAPVPGKHSWPLLCVYDMLTFIWLRGCGSTSIGIINLSFSAIFLPCREKAVILRAIN